MLENTKKMVAGMKKKLDAPLKGLPKSNPHNSFRDEVVKKMGRAKKVDQYKCQSYFEDGKLHNCSCGKCR